MIDHSLLNYNNSPPFMYNSAPNGYFPYGQQNYQNYYPQNYPYQQPYNPQYNPYCKQCPQMYYQNYANYPTNCHCQNCAQYGLSINKQRLTPKYPQKLPYSFVTSGDRVEDKLVINQPTHQSAPFPSQHRKTYVPYTRKYIEYQDYIQYVPVQRSQWHYEKVMKQIDFVPQEYYESNIEYIPQEKVEHKLRYLPVEQQIVHIPEEKVQPKQQQISHINTTQNYLPGQLDMSRRIIQIRNSNVINQPVKNAFAPMNQNTTTTYLRNFTNSQQDRRVVINQSPQIITNNTHQTTAVMNKSPPSMIRPAISSVQMVPSSRLRPVESIAQKLNNNKYNQSGGYQFPTTGGVIIGSSSQQSQSQSHPQNVNLDPFTNEANRIQASQVVTSVLNKLPKDSQQSHGLDFRQSGKVFSEQFNFDRHQYQKKESIVNEFQSDLNS